MGDGLMKNPFAGFVRKNGPELKALFTGGIPSFVYSPRPRKPLAGIPVFCYHLVEKATFKADARFLKENGYTTLNADALLAVLQKKRPPGPCEVVLSFDDGAFNFYKVAFPLLTTYDLNAVLFVCPGLHRTAKDETDAPNRLCTWEELLDMHRSGRVDIQSHTLEHRSIPRWPEPVPLTGIAPETVAGRRKSPTELADDLQTSKLLLEEALDKSVRHIAWPQYAFTTEAIALAKETGYEAFWTGTLPHHPLNHPAQKDANSVVRLSCEFVRRLPGTRRASLHSLLWKRYTQALRRKWTSHPEQTP
jgi:peptidoglycan/xylan/chitin deacetylase (PgdA/CDA1 family)